jgi:hypothetical protein
VLEFKEKHQIGGEARHFKFKFFEFGDIFWVISELLVSNRKTLQILQIRYF